MNTKLFRRSGGYIPLLGEPWASVTKARWMVGSSIENAVLITPWFLIEIGRGWCADVRDWYFFRLAWRHRMWSGFTRHYAPFRFNGRVPKHVDSVATSLDDLIWSIPNSKIVPYSPGK